MRFCLTTILLFSVLWSPLGLRAGEEALWPQWRGPERDGSSLGEAWPESLDALEQTWRVEGLGPSYSGPIVAEDRVFITETVNGETEVVRALRRDTGKEIWRAEWTGAMEVPFFARANGSWIRSTPTYDGESLFVGGIREVLVSLDAATGEERWRVDFPAKYGTPLPPFGFVSSPLVDGDALYVQAADSVLKLKKASGEVVWRSAVVSSAMTSSGAFGSPVLTTLAGRQQLVIQDREALRGIDPESGEVLWSEALPSFRGTLILTPTVIGDTIFTSAYQNGSRLYRIEATEGGMAAKLLWRSKVSGYMSSPVVVGEHVYLHLANQRATTLNLRSGEGGWTSTPFGKYWSLVTRGEQILALDEKGELLLLAANPEELTILDRRDLPGEDHWAHLAVSGEEVFIRDLGGITALRWKGAGD